ncbi:unnamed protein product [Aspergillus oryzae var. brunneus]|uniref:Unnamed protein product n=1 Tax=Aspergillus oryzae var. brunneus TaxID=332754 RepID=A0ABQ6K9N4_ASPOZ|nr:unnamed protein product [Aspergillus oryzae var. brunneus]
MVFSSVFRTFALCLLIAQVWAGGIQDLVNALMKPVEDSVSHLPPLDWVPHPKHLNTAPVAPVAPAAPAAPATPSAHAPLASASSCSSNNGSSGYWYEKIEHNDQSSFLSSEYKDSYKVFRNVVSDYKADNTGNQDSAPAIQRAIEGGTYLLQTSLQLFTGTVLVGDPSNPPVLKAASGYSLDHIVYAKDPNHEGTNNFYIGIKNIVLDSTGVDSAKSLSLLDWTVSQATQLANVAFHMPTGSKHTGLTTQYDYNRATDIVFLGCQFQQGAIGINASETSGSLTVIDSSASGLDTFITSGDSGGAGNAIVLENVQSSGVTVSLGGKAVLTGGVSDTWVHGTMRVDGKIVVTNRASSLLSGNKYYTVSPPTYQEYRSNKVLNIKSVSSSPVYGDGQTDDTANINKILSENKDCKVIYFPAGTYIVTDTIFVPSGTRIIGDAFASTISAVGNNFKDEAFVRVMIRVGVLNHQMEVNIAGKNQGDVGFWNVHFRIGGGVGSRVHSDCTSSPDSCKAAYGLLHLTGTSSAYIENMWGWTADHDLDGSSTQTISTGRGLLVEAVAATWLIGTGFEHHTLYQYNFEHAHNVLATMQQSETPYWQGVGSTLAPAPWGNHLSASDPDFSWCAGDDATCRMALFERINGASNLFLYGGWNWAFFNNNGGCNGKCQKNAVQIIESSALYLYGTNTKSTANMILEGSTTIATEDDNAGGWGGVIAAFLYKT